MKRGPFIDLDPTIESKYEIEAIGVRLNSTNTGDKYEKGYMCDPSYFSSTFEVLYNSTIKALPATKSKIFFMSGCITTQARLKEICKILGHQMTNDYSKADIVVVNDRSYLNDTYNPTILSYHTAASHIRTLTTDSENPSIAKAMMDFNVNSLYMNNGGNNWYDTTRSSLSKVFVSPLAVAVYDRYDAGEVSIMDEGTFVLISNGATRSPIEETDIEVINQLLSSYTDENENLAIQLMINIDPSVNQHLLWRLFNTGRSKLYVDRRNKDYRAWLEETDAEALYGAAADDVIQKMKAKNTLNKDAFLYLEGFARKEIRVINRDMYKITVTLKEEWQEYLK